MIASTPWAWVLVISLVGPAGLQPAASFRKGPSSSGAPDAPLPRGSTDEPQSAAKETPPAAGPGRGQAASESPPDVVPVAEARPEVEETTQDTAAPVLSPDLAEAAKRHFLRAQELLEEERYSDAAREFARSHEAVPTAVALYNMALAHERASEAVQAIRSYQTYLQRDDVVESRRKEVEDAIERLRDQVAEFSLATPADVELREVRVNGDPVEVDDFPLIVMPGSVRIELVSARDGQVHVRDYEVEAGQRITVDLALFAPPITALPESSSVAVPLLESNGRAIPSHLFWAGVAATATGGLSIVTLGLLAQREARRFGDKLCPEVCSDGLRDDHPYPTVHRKRALALQTATNVMVGVTAGLALATLVSGSLALAMRRRAPTSRARIRASAGGLAMSW